jgi:hypothetical protein
VTVGGTATALTLSGTLANINNFILNRLLYTPAANASGDVTLTININTTSVSDATTTVTLQVAAVNDAPVISCAGLHHRDRRCVQCDQRHQLHATSMPASAPSLRPSRCRAAP